MKRFANLHRLVYFALMELGEASSTGALPVEGRIRAQPLEERFWS
jgi:hypothetical protein